ncbi:efflux RND transporter periplasmic adaptor subunit [Flexibacterium corallicola]|uniref:efflux RND transporter periplasmic adaptor subunit n=1 Tax=Flexibacterium corallicola TaxID=3037259 RepID=UPI00286F8547|nr:efflux RND transporter periplasmic adaptor subunit [Pseudovibrio sp. M1P-2-3]
MPWSKKTILPFVLLLGVSLGVFYHAYPEFVSSKFQGEDDTQLAQASVSSSKKGASSARPMAATARNIILEAADNRIQAIGTSYASKKTTLYPESSGRISKITAKPGQHVEKGDILLELDNQEETLALRQSEAILQEAKEQVQRFESLIQSKTITTVQLNQALLAQVQAEVERDRARLNLERRSVVAPFGGVLGIIDVEIGDYVTQSTRIASLDDRSQLLIEFVVPERFTNKVKLGSQVELRAEAVPDRVFTGETSAIAARVDELSRTLKIQASVDNGDGLLVAGLSFDVRVLLEGEEWPSVPSQALRWDNNGAYIWLSRQGKATREYVRIIQRNPESVLVEGNITPGEIVLTETILRMRENTPLTLSTEAGQELTVPDNDSLDNSTAIGNVNLDQQRPAG